MTGTTSVMGCRAWQVVDPGRLAGLRVARYMVLCSQGGGDLRDVCTAGNFLTSPQWCVRVESIVVVATQE